MLKQKGDLVFEEPPVHMFDLAKFKEETMAFPPSVTVKDYTWGGSEGYLNPKRGATPARFRTIIQIVPARLRAPKQMANAEAVKSRPPVLFAPPAWQARLQKCAASVTDCPSGLSGAPNPSQFREGVPAPTLQN